MQQLAKQLFSGKTLRIMPEKQLRKLNVEVAEVQIQLGDEAESPVVRCFLSSPNNKLYILPDDFETIPCDLCNKLYIKDARPANTPASSTEIYPGRSSKNATNFLTYDDLKNKAIIIIPNQADKAGMSQYSSSVVKKITEHGDVDIPCLFIRKSKTIYLYLLQRDYDRLPKEIQNELRVSWILFSDNVRKNTRRQQQERHVVQQPPTEKTNNQSSLIEGKNKKDFRRFRFESVCDFNLYKTSVISRSVLIKELQQGSGRWAEIWIKDIERKTFGYYFEADKKCSFSKVNLTAYLYQYSFSLILKPRKVDT